MTIPIPTDHIEPNKFNPNVMAKEDYENLKKSMERHGPEGLYRYPIVCPKSSLYEHQVDSSATQECYVIIDGEHRWRIAKDLGWSTIKCEVREVDGEEAARRMVYQLNRLRGSIDPWKEAAFFRWEADRGKKQQQIADEYSIDRTTVSKRLSLLNITEETTKILKNVPRGTLQVSHYEIIAALKPPVQKDVAERVKNEFEQPWRAPNLSVRQLQRTAENAVEQYKEQVKFENAMKKAKHPNCPACKQRAISIAWNGLPNVRCLEHHYWNLKTGKLAREDNLEQEIEKQKEEAEAIPKTLRSKLPREDYNKGIDQLIRAVVPQLGEIDSIRLSGTFKGSKAALEASIYGNSTRFSWSMAGQRLSIKIEDYPYHTGEITKIGNLWPEPKSEEDLKKTQKFIEKMRKGQVPFVKEVPCPSCKSIQTVEQITDEGRQITCKKCGHIETQTCAATIPKFGEYGSCINNNRKNCPLEVQIACAQASDMYWQVPYLEKELQRKQKKEAAKDD